MAKALSVDDSSFDIRYTKEDDVSSLEKWLSNPEVLKWMPFSEGEELTSTIRGWMSFSRYQCTLTATWKGKPVGMGILYLMPYRKVAHHCLVNLVVDPEYQRQGVGGALIKNLKHLAKNYFHLEWLQFEVFEGSTFISLLKKYDFYEAVCQERFVKEGENYLSKIVMECDIRTVKRAPNINIKGYDTPWPSKHTGPFPPPKPKELSIRIMEPEDGPFFKKWLMDEVILQWFPMYDEREIDDSVRMWTTYATKGAGLTALWNGKPCGIAYLNLQYYKKFAHQCLPTFIVDEKIRGKGVGAILIEELCALAKEKFQIEFLHLEVYEGNPAIHLYTRAGFEIYGIDRHFIREKSGNYRAKILMLKNL